MAIYLKSRDYYEELYDHTTVWSARRDWALFKKLYDKWFEIMPDEKPNSFRSAFHLNGLYMQIVGNHLLERYDNRNQQVEVMMSRDEAKDIKIADARLIREPICIHCKKTGLRIKDKELYTRRDSSSDEQVLFTLECNSCQKFSLYWEDGGVWSLPPTLCPKCHAVMDKSDSRKGMVITTLYKCPDCSHSFKDHLDLGVKKEDPDPEFESDKYAFCLHDPKSLEEHRDAKRRYDGLIEMAKEFKQREENKEIYDAVTKLKKLKIAELSTLLSPVIGKEEYSEFRLDKPEMGRTVIIPFSCLDNKPNRKDYESRSTLKKTITKILGDTNWRLMSDGISYRLGYLTGRLKAYETEEDMLKIVKSGGSIRY